MYDASMTALFVPVIPGRVYSPAHD
jgi:hypothetical protein